MGLSNHGFIKIRLKAKKCVSWFVFVQTREKISLNTKTDADFRNEFKDGIVLKLVM